MRSLSGVGRAAASVGAVAHRARRRRRRRAAAAPPSRRRAADSVAPARPPADGEQAQPTAMSGAGDPERVRRRPSASPRRRLAGLRLGVAPRRRAFGARRRRLPRLVGAAARDLGAGSRGITSRDERARRPRASASAPPAPATPTARAPDSAARAIARVAPALEHLEHDAIELRRDVAPAPRRRIDLRVLDLIGDRARDCRRSTAASR